jgi:molecular chaperone DnaK (HSP70)
MKYMKTWMGVTSGTMAGRDDGYPEMKYRHYNSIDELAKDFGKQSQEKYYLLSELDKDVLLDDVKKSLEKQNEKAKEQKKSSIESQIEELQKQLKNL